MISLVGSCSAGQTNTENTRTSKAKSAEEDTDAGGETEQDATEKQASGVSSEGEGTTTGVDGREFFEANVLPKFENECRSCHADPRVSVQSRGPLSIYSYESDLELLKEGESSVDNTLIRRITGRDDHGGGKRCSLEESPCAEVVEWWKAEFGDDGAGGGASASGKPAHIEQMEPLGEVYGWALDAKNPSDAATARIYIDGDNQTGTEIASVTADDPGPDGGFDGYHRFKAEIPAEYRDQTQRDVYLYAVVDGEEIPAEGNPYSYTGYSKSEAGRRYFENNVEAELQSACEGCHDVGYDKQFPALISPSPAAGGSADNNRLFNKPSQSNGTNHGGGTRCGSNNSPCREIQMWWEQEFGQN